MKHLSSAIAVMLIGASLVVAPSLARAEAGDPQDPTAGHGRYYTPYVPYDEPYSEPYYASPYYDDYYYGGPGYLAPYVAIAPYFYYREFGRHRGFRRFGHRGGRRFHRGFRRRR